VDPKPPVVVTSFRVIFVIESSVTPPPGQVSISDAKIVRDYLNTTTTKDGTRPGWRRYDPQENVTNENATFKALWASVVPKLSTIPCIVIEVNGAAEILPYPTTPEATIALCKSKNGGK
jgi:hypothetical protein